MATQDCIQSRWAALGQMDRAALRLAWIEAFGDAPPHFVSMIFMRKALIWQTQCKTYGGLRPDTKRALKAAACDLPGQAKVAEVRTGTQLVREWNGRKYQVEVIEDGFRMKGERFRSLSAIALRITGTNWSGPRFFGLSGKAGGAS